MKVRLLIFIIIMMTSYSSNIVEAKSNKATVKLSNFEYQNELKEIENNLKEADKDLSEAKVIVNDERKLKRLKRKLN